MRVGNPRCLWAQVWGEDCYARPWRKLRRYRGQLRCCLLQCPMRHSKTEKVPLTQRILISSIWIHVASLRWGDSGRRSFSMWSVITLSNALLRMESRETGLFSGSDLLDFLGMGTTRASFQILGQVFSLKRHLNGIASGLASSSAVFFLDSVG